LKYRKSIAKVCYRMNRLQRAIKRQERTRGDAPADDRAQCDSLKTEFDRLFQDATTLGQCLDRPLPPMEEEPSDDERETRAAKKLDSDLSEGLVGFLFGEYD
jgi:hypothetical protein